MNPEESKTQPPEGEAEQIQNSHIARILEDDEFGKQFDVGPDAKKNAHNKASIFDIFSPYEWRFIIWSSIIFILCILAFSSVGSLFHSSVLTQNQAYQLRVRRENKPQILRITSFKIRTTIGQQRPQLSFRHE